MGLDWVSDERVCEMTSCFCYCPVDRCVQLSLESVTELSMQSPPSAIAISSSFSYNSEMSCNGDACFFSGETWHQGASPTPGFT